MNYRVTAYDKNGQQTEDATEYRALAEARKAFQLDVRYMYDGTYRGVGSVRLLRISDGEIIAEEHVQ